MMTKALGFGTEGISDDIISECGIDIADDADELLKISKNYGVILFGLGQKNVDRKRILEKLRSENDKIKIVGIVDSKQIRIATKLLKSSLDDFLVKNSNNFRKKLKSILEEQTNAAAIGDGSAGLFPNLDLFYSDPKIKKVMELLEKIARAKISVLLEGETGCEHEIYAKAIHNMGNQKNGEFFPIFCPSLTKSTFEKAILGDFNDGENALNLKKLLELKNGTIYLERIDSLDFDAQIILTKFLDAKADDINPSNVKIIASSVKNLREEADGGRFRRELYYRINGFVVEITALREKREFIPMFVKDLYKFYAVQESKNIKGITDRALKMLEAHDWPGNIRELKNIVYNAVVINQSGVLDEGDFLGLTKNSAAPEENGDGLVIRLVDGFGNFKSLKDVELETVNKYIKRFNGNFSTTSKNLKIGRATLYRKLGANVR
ncbi:MAG: sigma 54-interacting transcriptional regulator [Rickettsiales bacterium]|jgi:two-component system response regulator AtoC|nr:sigma 54-interacting transcriptional regulator [Rickettsiales bacterium]